MKTALTLLPLLAALTVTVPLVQGDEPALPAGPGDDEPALPAGIESDEPALPLGLGEAEAEADRFTVEREPADSAPWGLTGFWETRVGYRVQDPADQRHWSLAETRLELEKDFNWQGWTAKLTADLLYDAIEPSQHNAFDTGQGWLDLREAWVQRRLGERGDLKVGRQVLTWGVGDLLFINDLFPKDWNSFLAGRDEQYLKAPSDALRAGFYSDAFNINLVYSPRFDGDRYIDGRRLSYFDSASGQVVGRDGLVHSDSPGRDEIALRLYRSLGRFEVALYGYDGFWKSPGGFDPRAGRATFPALRVWGASARGPVGPGIVSVEVGYYDSRRDRRGTDPFINNSEWRALVGYEREVARNTTLAVQYYLEALQDYGGYRDALFPGQPTRDQFTRDEYRQLATVRLTRLAMNQNLTWSLFAFVSPSDRDFYLRPKVSYKVSDSWLVEGGANLFGGSDSHTFFGQFESNSNVWVAVRWSF